MPTSNLYVAHSTNRYIDPDEAHTQVQQNKMFHLAMEHSAIGLALLDPEGRWLKVNPALCQMVGYTKRELLKTDFQTITHPDDLKADLDTISRLLAGEMETYSLHKRYYHKNGHIIWALLTVSLARDEDHQPLYFIAQIQDRTQQYVTKERLEQAHAEIQKFTAKLSHDIRSPLSSSLRLLDFVDRDLGEGDVERARETMDIVRNQIDQLYSLTNDILEIRKTQVAEEPCTDVDLKALVEGTLNKFSYLDKANKVAIYQSIDYTQPLYTKRNCIISIVENLLSNAIKYQDVEEDQPYVSIECFEEGQRVVFQVSDNGLGIKERYHGRVFDMFQRFHGHVPQGSGLGLYLIKKSVQAIGGTIDYIPLEKGSRFKLSIPKGK
ncbi:MAG: PAS domain S-box protein [Bacteroidota bacterium]